MDSPWARGYSRRLAFPPTFLNWLSPLDGSHLAQIEMAPMKIESEGDRNRVGPHPSYISVAKPYIFEQTIQKCLQNTTVSPAKEENIRLLGITWIDNVRRALKLPVRTFDTAAVYYHKFRLVHPDVEFAYVDAAAAALFTACKIEDTLKKSRDILCAAYNLKTAPSDQLSPDDAVFEHHSRTIIGLERLMLEASSFDFRNRHPQVLLIKLAKKYGYHKTSPVIKTAYGISLDLYRTFAPLKQTTATMAFACLELAGRLHNEPNEIILSGEDYRTWKVSRSMVMETLLDLLELYTHNRTSTTIGPDFAIDTFLEIRIPLNQEVESKDLPRYTEWRAKIQNQQPPLPVGRPTSPTSPRANGTVNGTDRRGAMPPTGPATGANSAPLPPRRSATANALPTSPTAVPIPSDASATTAISSMVPQPVVNGTARTVSGARVGERGREGTVRFMLNPEREREERNIVKEYFVENDDEASAQPNHPSSTSQQPQRQQQQRRDLDPTGPTPAGPPNRDNNNRHQYNRDRDRDRDSTRNGTDSTSAPISGGGGPPSRFDPIGPSGTGNTNAPPQAPLGPTGAGRDASRDRGGGRGGGGYRQGRGGGGGGHHGWHGHGHGHGHHGRR